MTFRRFAKHRPSRLKPPHLHISNRLLHWLFTLHLFRHTGHWNIYTVNISGHYILFNAHSLLYSLYLDLTVCYSIWNVRVNIFYNPLLRNIFPNSLNTEDSLYFYKNIWNHKKNHIKRYAEKILCSFGFKTHTNLKVYPSLLRV